VFIGGGVEHHLNPIGGENLLEALGIDDIGKHGVEVHLRRQPAPQVLVNGMKGRLTVFEQQQRSRFVLKDLAA
jgi:hypothetical protein